MARSLACLVAAAALAACASTPPAQPEPVDAGVDDYWALPDGGPEEPIVHPDAGSADSGTSIGGDGGVPVSTTARIIKITPARGGASVATEVTISGEGFTALNGVEVGGVAAGSVTLVDSKTVRAIFQSVDLTQVGKRDVALIFQNKTALLQKEGFEYWFDEDPIVFVHGFSGGAWHWSVMLDRFRAMGYPDSHLNAISYSDSFGSSLPNVQELSLYVSSVLQKTGAPKVDMVIHSMGGLSSRLWIKQGGYKMVRDYMSIAGAHHGTETAYLSWSDGAAEMRPPYACQGDSLNDLQFILNGCLGDSGRLTYEDETPYGVEDGFNISYRAIVSTTDEIVIPHQSGCLNQKQKNDCSDPINTEISWQGHGSILLSRDVFDRTLAHLRTRNRSK